MKYLSIFLILIAVSVSAQTMTDDIPELIARQQYAFNFYFGFKFGGGSTGSGSMTNFLLLPGTTDKLLIPGTSDKILIP